MATAPRFPRIKSILSVFVVVTASCASEAVAAAPEEGKSLESWDAVFLAGYKVGFIHTYIEPVNDKGRELLRVRVDLELHFKRQDDFLTTKMQYGTIEELDGAVLRLDTRTQVGEQELRVHGDVIDKKMKLVFEGTGQRQEQVIDWPSETRGPYAAEQSLSRKLMKTGEVRDLKMFMPDLNKICDIKLTAVGMEEVKLGGNVTRSLLRVEQTTMLDGKPRPEFDMTVFVDAKGGVLMSRSDNNGGTVMYRTTAEGAKAIGEAAASFDQIANSVIRIKRKLLKPEATRNIRYKITLKADDPSKIIPQDRRQTLSPGSSKLEAILEVKTAGQTVGTAGPEKVDEEFLRPNAMITSQDERVVEAARKAIGNESDPWKRAVLIEKWVAKNLTEKNFSIGFASASEVAQNLTGDCTEHSVLTAAMCRAAGVPARVVVGLVYASQLNGFGFHMWNEVYVNRRWVALDASFDQDDVDAVHIKLADASLDGVAPFEAFLPIVRVLGKMSIEPIEVR